MDYHHYQFPLGGIIRDIKIIPGQEISGGYVGWDAVNKRYTFDPSAVGWQALETRGRVILETKEFGLVALLPIGMSPVSSVTFEPALKDGVEVHKGDLMGHFRFGGSDFVLLFQHGHDLELDIRHLEAAQSFPHMLMGERLGHLRHPAHNALVHPNAFFPALDWLGAYMPMHSSDRTVRSHAQLTLSGRLRPVASLPIEEDDAGNELLAFGFH
jgi:hypothetical protein